MGKFSSSLSKCVSWEKRLSIGTVNQRPSLKVSEIFSQSGPSFITPDSGGTSGCEGKDLNLDTFQLQVSWDYVQTDTFSFSFAPFV